MRYGARAIAIVIFGALLATAAFADESAKPKNSKHNAGDSSATAAPKAPQAQKPAPQSPAATESRRSENTPAVEVFGGYSFIRLNPKSASTTSPGTTVDEHFDFHGGTASLTGNLNNWFGLTADFGAYRGKDLPTALSASQYTFMFGPQFSYHGPKLHTFAHVLLGADRLTSRASVTPTGANFFNRTFNENAFATALGGGVDANLGKLVALRVFQGEYLITKFNDGKDNQQHSIRLSAGIVFRFGGGPPPPPPNRPPVIDSLTPNPARLFAGSGESSVVQAQAHDPDNDQLTYEWATTGGKVEGSGAEVRWNSTGVAPGNYTVSLKVDDGRGGTANSSTQIQVEQRPNRPPVISDCSANPSTVEAGKPSTITTKASDPDGDPLTYSYQATGGKVTGTGETAQFDSTGLAEGTYTITCNVDDGRGGKADARTNVSVQKPAEQQRLEQKLSLHSIYFPTAQPTVQNPNGGLLASQQRTLTTLANDFNQYLKFKPDAHLVLQGHADPRGGEAYNKALSERRVTRTKNFLAEHGVPAAAIDTEGLGEEQPMSADQVKQAVDQDQTLTPAQKKQLTRNARVLALAQARRVDVTLPSTGQTSVRQFPFNAEDALNLINPRGVGTKAPARGKKPTAKKPGAKRPAAKTP